MSMLDFGYFVGVIPCAIAALCMPLVWWKPGIFGPIIFYFVVLGFVGSSVLMSGAIK